MKKVGEPRSLLQTSINESSIPFSAATHLERLANVAHKRGVLGSEIGPDDSFGEHANKRCKVRNIITDIAGHPPINCLTNSEGQNPPMSRPSAVQRKKIWNPYTMKYV